VVPQPGPRPRKGATMPKLSRQEIEAAKRAFAELEDEVPASPRPSPQPSTGSAASTTGTATAATATEDGSEAAISAKTLKNRRKRARRRVSRQKLAAPKQ
jgi:hypothetical protein